MPAVKILNNPADVFVWHITETLEKLLDLNLEEIRYQSLRYKTETHRKQFLAKYLLLKELNLTDNVSYLSNGKPVLNDGQYISISHSGPYVGLALSQEPVGIDIEKNTLKLERIAKRFVNDNDYDDNQAHNILQWIWTAKESVYKLAGIKGLSFKNDIIIEYLDIERFFGIAKLKEQKIALKFSEIDDDFLFCMAYYI